MINFSNTGASATPSGAPNSAAGYGRRDALRIGGITLSLGAIVAACGDVGDDDAAPGRVGEAPVVTDLGNFPVNDAVLLRTASSIEYSIVAVYAAAKDLGIFDGAGVALADRLVENHLATAATMGVLTVAAGGTAWTTTNPWIIERTVDPILATIDDSDDPPRDMTNFLITFENVNAATYQTFARDLGAGDQRVAAATACSQGSRQSAALVLDAYGTNNRYTPLLAGKAVEATAEGLPQQYAISSAFGSVGQFELVVGSPDANGARSSYILTTPAANSYIYEELSES